MAKETTIARESGVMGLRSRNAIGGRADRAHGRATYPSMNKRSTLERVKSGEWAPQNRERIEFGNGVSARDIGKSYEVRQDTKDTGVFIQYFDHGVLDAKEVWNKALKRIRELQK